MPKMPFEQSYPMTQDWNDPRYRASYYQFKLLGHNGQDFGTPSGTKIVAPHGGRVVEAAFDAKGYGWYIKIENDKEGSVLAHFKEAPKVSAGNSVEQGQLVGLSGNTGNSTGPHLHWGYYRFPRKRDNGFSGTVDQTHWINQEGENYLDELIEMKKLWNKCKNTYEDFMKKCEKEAASFNEHIKNLQSTVAEQNAQIGTMNDTISASAFENKSLREACRALEAEIVAMTASKNKEIDDLHKIATKMYEDHDKLAKEIQDLTNVVEGNLKSYGWWKRLVSLFRR